VGVIRPALRRGALERAALGTLALRIGARLLALPTALILARALGPSAYGAYAYGLTWAVVLGLVSTAGLDRFLVKAVARYAAHGEPARVRAVAAWGVRAATVTSLALAALFGAVAPLFVKSEFLRTTWICLALVPLFALTTVRQAVLQGLGRIELSFVPAQVVLPAILLALVGATVGAHLVHVDSAAAGGLNVAASAVAFASGTVLARRFLPAERAAATRPDRGGWSRGLVPFALVNVVTLAQVQSGVLILGSLGRAADAGVYQVASRLAEAGAFALTAFNAPLAPRAAALSSLEQRSELGALARRTARASVAVAAPLFLAAVFFRGPLLGLFGDGYARGADALLILIGAQLLSAVVGPVGILLLMTGGERLAAAGFATGLVVSVPAGVLLASRLGATGAALGQLLGVALWNVLLWLGARRRLGIDASAFGLAIAAAGE
jgi:O-antigen/teichoic acid export membrane protein